MAAAASRLGAAPPRADRGAATIRAGSAPMPRTPRLPAVRISKSRSFSSTPKSSRAALSASSTLLPVNSRYALISGVYLGGPAAEGRRGRPGPGIDRGWQGDRESGRGADREGRLPAEEREHPAPAREQVLLDDREDRRDDDVQEETRRPRRPEDDVDQREDRAHLALDALVRVVLVDRDARRKAHPRLEEHQPAGHQAEDADPDRAEIEGHEGLAPVDVEGDRIQAGDHVPGHGVEHRRRRAVEVDD